MVSVERCGQVLCLPLEQPTLPPLHPTFPLLACLPQAVSATKPGTGSSMSSSCVVS